MPTTTTTPAGRTQHDAHVARMAESKARAQALAGHAAMVARITNPTPEQVMKIARWENES